MNDRRSVPTPERHEADRAMSRAWSSAVQRIAGLPFLARSPRRAALEIVAAASAPGRTTGDHVHLANAHSIAVAAVDPVVAQVFTHPRGWLLPDGRPLTWASRWRGDVPRLQQVRGPQLMLDVIDLGRPAGLRHYLLGGTPEVLSALSRALEHRFPGARIVGADSPPFRAATPSELVERDAAIRGSGAQVVWVGLGTPKQDLEAARLAASVPVVTVAVGAAFDYAAGSLRPAPRWISIAGFEWLWRFAAEPRRLWHRYTVGNVRFVRALVAHEFQDLRRLGGRIRSARRRAVTVVGQAPPPLHGSTVMTGRLVDALTGLGHEVGLVDRRFSRSIDEVGRAGLRKVVAIPSLVVRFILAVGRSNRVILLITTTPGSFLVDSLLIALVREPVVLYVHTVGFRALAARGRVWEALVRRAFDRASKVVVLGPALVDDVASFVEQARIRLIPNCSPPVPSARRSGRTDVRLLFLGNLLPGKGADAFVRLASRLGAERPDVAWGFDVAGAGDAAALGPLPHGLAVHGRVVGDAKRALLEGADVLVVPSTYALEAQPLVIIEALSYGLPVVAYDTGGIRDLVDHSVGALVPSGDETALAAAVTALIAEPRRLQEAGAAALDRYWAAHTPEAFASSWQLLLEDAAPDAPQVRAAAADPVRFPAAMP